MYAVLTLICFVNVSCCPELDGGSTSESSLRLLVMTSAWSAVMVPAMHLCSEAVPSQCQLTLSSERTQQATRCDADYYMDKSGKLGPDPLRQDADSERLWDKMRISKKPVGGILMDQTAVAGIGNIYRAEILFKVLYPDAVQDLVLPVIACSWAVSSQCCACLHAMSSLESCNDNMHSTVQGQSNINLGHQTSCVACEMADSAFCLVQAHPLLFTWEQSHSRCQPGSRVTQGVNCSP